MVSVKEKPAEFEPIPPHHRGVEVWQAGILKVTKKGLIWFMDTMCLGLCPWVKKIERTTVGGIFNKNSTICRLD